MGVYGALLSLLLLVALPVRAALLSSSPERVHSAACKGGMADVVGL